MRIALMRSTVRLNLSKLLPGLHIVSHRAEDCSSTLLASLGSPAIWRCTSKTAYPRARRANHDNRGLTGLSSASHVGTGCLRPGIQPQVRPPDGRDQEQTRKAHRRAGRGGGGPLRGPLPPAAPPGFLRSTYRRRRSRCPPRRRRAPRARPRHACGEPSAQEATRIPAKLERGARGRDGGSRRGLDRRPGHSGRGIGRREPAGAERDRTPPPEQRLGSVHPGRIAVHERARRTPGQADAERPGTMNPLPRAGFRATVCP
jgi:hypothetical protein